ncbi:DNA polymerase delta subunit 3 like protein [Argiope bruennichi]|uniref:DNA polymerase delta subunit 3 n=1 Tax=Argiope bruennichi TaxID=94029 RepID=A0A8T0FQ96_ARGBR|nr:DNA polymerase delta subunit 3 like protein [Argiope bruennichi]
MTREEYFEKLEQLILDESEMVTYKIASRELKISVNEAKQYLQEFLDNHNSENLTATYFLSGISKKEPGNPLKVYVVYKNNLEKFKESLSEVTSCHVYCVCKAVKADEGILYNLDVPYNENEEDNRNYAVIKQPNIEMKAPVLSKMTNGIKKEVKAAIPQKMGASFFKNVASNSSKNNENTEPSESIGTKEAAKPVESSKTKTQSPVKISNSESKPQKLNTLASMWQKSENKSKKGENPKADGKGKTKSPQETKQMPKNNILSMFSKQSEKKIDNSSKKSPSVSETVEESGSSKEIFSKSESPIKTEKLNEAKSSKPSSDKKKKINQRQTKVSKHKKDDESDDEFQPKKKKHRRICTFDDSESESESEEIQDRVQRNFLSPEKPMEIETPAKSATPPSDDEEPIPPTPPVISNKGKKKVWKTVQKTFEDEDGFFVTKQEKVLVSEDDEDPVPHSSKSKEVNKSNQFTYRKQASLTSFFKQK